MEMNPHKDLVQPRGNRTPEEVVHDILQARGGGNAFLMALGGLVRQPWTDDWRIAERIVRVIQARGAEGRFNPLERNAMIAHFVQSAAQARAEEEPEFLAVDREMERIERQQTGDEHGMLRLADAPEEYHALDRRWNALVALAMSDWLDELSEPELARFAREQPEAFEQMIQAGEVMIATGADDIDAVMDMEVPADADATANLAVIAAMKGTTEANELWEALISGLWKTPDDVHAAATARFAQMLASSGHLNGDETYCILDALSSPIAIANGMSDPEMRAILSHSESAETVEPNDAAALEDAIVRLKALWLDEVDPPMAALLRANREDYERRCAAGSLSLFGRVPDTNG